MATKKTGGKGKKPKAVASQEPEIERSDTRERKQESKKSSTELLAVIPLSLFLLFLSLSGAER
jgi:hypothetical protein